MGDRLLSVRSIVLGLGVALSLFVPLHLLLGAGLARGLLVGGAGAVLTAGLIWYLRRAEILRTTQAQGYFIATLMIVAIALVMLPPGYLARAFSG